ncbi:MAG: cardiolipin synthase [Planctomycetota bacterium]
MFESVVTLLGVLLHLAAISWLLVMERRNPTATLAWLLAIIFLPVVGILLFLAFGATRSRRIARHSREAESRVAEVLERYSVREHIAGSGPGGLGQRTLSLVNLADRLATTPASRGNLVRILPSAAAAYREIIRSIRGAEDHIHVLFYIVRPDRAGKALRDRLVRRAREGIRVRVLCDAVGSLSLPPGFWDPLRAAGGQAALFRKAFSLYARIRHQDRVDFRNHRKIVVVDGQVGFTGGINVGLEYLGLSEDTGPWRDTQVALSGPAVLSLQRTFAEDWCATTDELIDDARYFPEPREAGGSTVQIVDSGPDRKWSPISLVLTHAMALSRRRLWITSPYFVPGPAVENAMVSAALRGVDVRLLVPERSDSLLATLAGRTWYRPLLEAGVRIYLYERGFVHAKTMVVDSWAGTIGSANMDMRSFHLNFELNAFLYDREVVEELAGQFRSDLRHCSEVDLEEERAVGIPARLARNAARLLSPLL